MARSVLHSAENPAWTTPGWFLDRVRRVMPDGRIDLDPMSSEIANRTVQARNFFVKPDALYAYRDDPSTWIDNYAVFEHGRASEDCFVNDWVTRGLFANFAGGLVVEAHDKWTLEVEAGRCEAGVILGYSLGQLALLANKRLHPLDFSCCILRNRISFVREDGTTGSPSHPNFAFAFGIIHEQFAEAFGDLGKITRGAYAI